MTDLLDEIGLWESVAEVARRKGITRQSLNERVDRLASEGLIKVRRDGRSKLISVAEFDRVVGEVGDAVKEGAAATRAEADGDAEKSGALRDHQARAAQYTADLKFLDLEERLGRLVPVADVKEAAAKCAAVTVRVIDQLPTHADSIAAAIGKDGPAGARAKLKQLARDMRTAIAEAHGELARNAEPVTLEPADAT
jgi:hypothetical protein